MCEKGGWGHISPFVQYGPAYSRPDYPLGVMCEEITDLPLGVNSSNGASYLIRNKLLEP